jgi:hypothetical protein
MSNFKYRVTKKASQEYFQIERSSVEKDFWDFYEFSMSLIKAEEKIKHMMALDTEKAEILKEFHP